MTNNITPSKLNVAECSAKLVRSLQDMLQGRRGSNLAVLVVHGMCHLYEVISNQLPLK